jgi:16S rRNA processing protein RimM
LTTRLPKEPSTESRPDRLLLGEIVGAQGIKGEVRIRSFTSEPLAIADYGPLDTDSAATVELFDARQGPKGVIARVKGVRTRNDAEALTGTRLYVERDLLPKAEDEEWYHLDLVGLVAVSREGSALGQVVSVQNFGASDLLEIRPATGGDTVLVPFTRDVVPEIDVEGGWLLVVPPEGLFE